VEPDENIYIMTPEEKARRILELRSQGKTYREIQRLLRVSPNDIARALRREAFKDELMELKTTVQRLEQQIAELKLRLDKAEGRSLELENWAKSFSESMKKALDVLDARLRKLEGKRGFLKLSF
jgi:DNA repair exonuclease SbcCD ATPase subunit